ncbi:MAG: energy-coupling factor transporter transmembrane protein EcfT [Firmicutes bacterium]|nr:energy-coupling factor transporter transmembrane protein EcfT [Bacillota bacterium]
MLRDMVIGQYVPGKSPLHRMNAPLKMILMIAYIAVLLVIKSAAAYALFTVCTAALIMISGVSVGMILKGIKPILYIVIFTALLNIFMTPGEAMWSASVFGLTLRITKEGVTAGALLTVRLIYLVAGTSLLTLTTPPLQLTDGIERLLRPLNKIKVPSHEIAMMMTIAIRFIPTFSEEADKIKKAQTARGADFESGGLIKRARAMTPLLVPLFISAFRRADELAEAMEARCYRGGGNRTKMKERHITAFDIKAAVIFVLAAVLILLVEFWIEI